MENFYLLIVVILFALAISDLIVGVANDAVNFLNSAIGAKVAPRYIILIIASIGIVLGTTFSGGMMEVAQKGIFYPGQFAFSEIMIIFLAVMLTDVILLDIFNAFGLPTSTTVSLVFELLGAAVAVAVIKITAMGTDMSEMSKYINSANALAIISGILLSVIIAFTFGTLIQYFARILFSFNYEKTYKYFGAIWGGLSITVITYFILIKGAKGSTLLSPETTDWIHNNSSLLILYSFIGWTIILQLLYWITRINILKLIVLVGTFALALAFAGNDLVNFVGAPVAGFKSFQAFIAEPGANPDGFMMTALESKIKTDTYLLLIAGMVMVFALWFSKKARKVTETEVSLGRQSVGNERFGSSMLSRSIVRIAMDFNKTFEKVVPKPVKKWINSRFDSSEYQKKIKNQKDAPSFDLIRASVNLTVASALIAFGTSLKLPLSTTYVTFMVAMGSSLADNAWGRESAVYRITGVITVIGGWFFTAFVAFTSAFILALIISYGGPVAIVILILIALFLVLRTHIFFKRRESEKAKIKKLEDEELKIEDIHQKCSIEVRNMLKSVIQVFNDTLIGLTKEDRKLLKNVCKDVDELNIDARNLKANVHNTLYKLQVNDEEAETGPYYVQVIDYLREMAHALSFISNPSYDHIDNNHKGLNHDQVEELNALKEDISSLFELIITTIEKNDFENIPDLIEKQQLILDKLTVCRKKQVKRIKHQESGTRISILYLGILNEIKNFLLQSINLVKAQRDFVDTHETK
ncbi:MAG: phosphate permease [Bacteroidetes bacterium GWC2_33_15]|nr:MAG: phosphate permease [Bacteroidetes bacterium GWA2_33_15]OFX52230.1 MAG: phosphate permease [Bacteroidetes bacterium GWC2_33_15]OFX64384.1 MAG: phosphate permease [Bacteroidetes bacterium GWB2_32_14]OFX67789.1 MAG: phosphate permease [Bacteroidetes bacterium GWD2_33_33]HAN19401.1 phosphate permease [Bacteroidales bacterium]